MKRAVEPLPTPKDKDTLATDEGEPAGAGIVELERLAVAGLQVERRPRRVGELLLEPGVDDAVHEPDLLEAGRGRTARLAELHDQPKITQIHAVRRLLLTTWDLGGDSLKDYGAGVVDAAALTGQARRVTAETTSRLKARFAAQ